MSKQLKWILGISLFVTVIFCSSFVFFFLRAQRRAQQENETPATVEAPLPATQLVDAEGVAVDELLRRGKVILIFVTADCNACKIEASFIQTVIDKRPDIRYYGVISFGERKSALAGAAGVFPFKVFFDENAGLAAKLGVTRVPIKVYLEDGVVKKAWGGASYNEEKQREFSEWLDSHK